MKHLAVCCCALAAAAAFYFGVRWIELNGVDAIPLPCQCECERRPMTSIEIFRNEDEMDRAERDQ